MLYQTALPTLAFHAHFVYAVSIVHSRWPCYKQKNLDFYLYFTSRRRHCLYDMIFSAFTIHLVYLHVSKRHWLILALKSHSWPRRNEAFPTQADTLTSTTMLSRSWNNVRLCFWSTTIHYPMKSLMKMNHILINPNQFGPCSPGFNIRNVFVSKQVGHLWPVSNHSTLLTVFLKENFPVLHSIPTQAQREHRAIMENTVVIGKSDREYMNKMELNLYLKEYLCFVGARNFSVALSSRRIDDCMLLLEAYAGKDWRCSSHPSPSTWDVLYFFSSSNVELRIKLIKNSVSTSQYRIAAPFPCFIATVYFPYYRLQYVVC